MEEIFQSPVENETANSSGGLQSSTDSNNAKFENGTIKWTIPVELSVSVPSLAVDRRESKKKRQSKSRRSRSEQRKQKMLDEFSQRNIDRAKRAFEKHKDDVYYDQEADNANNIAYYSDIADAWVGEELFLALRDLLEKTHTNRLNYDTARYDHLYPIVDLRENRSLASIYSGKPVEFERVIATEALTQARHELAIQEFMQREGAFDELRINEFRVGLEARDPFNCEHLVVQSWFDRRNPMKSDLHHLTTCEPGCNSSRNDNAYFNFQPDLADFDRDCGQVERSLSRFEPANGKGIAARATLYYLLRYPSTLTATDRAMKADRIPTLLEWHKAEPVTLFELHRNAEIHRIQGNRNPLIDFPDWAEHIPFELGFA